MDTYEFFYNELIWKVINLSTKIYMTQATWELIIQLTI